MRTPWVAFRVVYNTQHPPLCPRTKIFIVTVGRIELPTSRLCNPGELSTALHRKMWGSQDSNLKPPGLGELNHLDPGALPIELPPQ